MPCIDDNGQVIPQSVHFDFTRYPCPTPRCRDGARGEFLREVTVSGEETTYRRTLALANGFRYFNWERIEPAATPTDGKQGKETPT